MTQRRTPEGITRWEEGQVLIKASDELFECASELRKTQPKLAEMLFHMGCQVGSAFNEFGSHQFGLRGLEECPCKDCKYDRSMRRGHFATREKTP